MVEFDVRSGARARTDAGGSAQDRLLARAGETAAGGERAACRRIDQAQVIGLHAEGEVARVAEPAIELDLRGADAALRAIRSLQGSEVDVRALQDYHSA